MDAILFLGSVILASLFCRSLSNVDNKVEKEGSSSGNSSDKEKNENTGSSNGEEFDKDNSTTTNLDIFKYPNEIISATSFLNDSLVNVKYDREQVNVIKIIPEEGEGIIQISLNEDENSEFMFLAYYIVRAYTQITAGGGSDNTKSYELTKQMLSYYKEGREYVAADITRFTSWLGTCMKVVIRLLEELDEREAIKECSNVTSENLSKVISVLRCISAKEWLAPKYGVS